MTNALNAIGRIKITLSLMAMWTVLTWGLTTLLLPIYGFNGFSIALFLISFTIVVVVHLVKRVAPFSFWKSINWPLFAALTEAGWFMLAVGNPPYSLSRLVAVGVSGVILYGGIVWAFDRRRILTLIWRKDV